MTQEKRRCHAVRGMKDEAIPDRSSQQISSIRTKRSRRHSRQERAASLTTWLFRAVSTPPLYTERPDGRATTAFCDMFGVQGHEIGARADLQPIALSLSALAPASVTSSNAIPSSWSV